MSEKVTLDDVRAVLERMGHTAPHATLDMLHRMLKPTAKPVAKIPEPEAEPEAEPEIVEEDDMDSDDGKKKRRFGRKK